MYQKFFLATKLPFPPIKNVFLLAFQQNYLTFGHAYPGQAKNNVRKHWQARPTANWLFDSDKPSNRQCINSPTPLPQNSKKAFPTPELNPFLIFFFSGGGGFPFCRYSHAKPKRADMAKSAPFEMACPGWLRSEMSTRSLSESLASGSWDYYLICLASQCRVNAPKR